LAIRFQSRLSSSLLWQGNTHRFQIMLLDADIAQES